MTEQEIRLACLKLVIMIYGENTSNFTIGQLTEKAETIFHFVQYGKK